jgi:hypothetical protein
LMIRQSLCYFGGEVSLFMAFLGSFVPTIIR